MSAHLRLVEPRNVNRSVPVRPANAKLRQREYLTAKEVEKLIKAAKDDRGRYGDRDATMILIAVPPWSTSCRNLRSGMVASRVRPVRLVARQARQER